MTKREAILAALAAQLVSVPGVSDSHVYRSKVVPLSRNIMPAITVEPLNDTPQSTSVPMLDWSLVVRIGVLVNGNNPDQTADPIVESIHSKVMADQTLAGLCMDIQPLSVSFELYDTDNGSMVVKCDYRVTYRTSEKNLSS